MDWTNLLIGAAGLGTLCVVWALWLRISGRIDPEMRRRAEEGHKCGIPKDIDAPKPAPPTDHEDPA
ncbi:hypothetical protein MNBD_PLANCTO03-2095 [hydrothermal vent metagenome]|uniref:Uncharacterized protein n=1 Tax=hydrothermal vent metagenome TaxID=652676 RepID=A0A3B1DQT7_9ZZZZ